MPEVGGGVRLGSMPSGISRGVDGGAHGPKDQFLRGSWSSKLVLKVGPRRKNWSSPADNKKRPTIQAMGPSAGWCATRAAAKAQRAAAESEAAAQRALEKRREELQREHARRAERRRRSRYGRPMRHRREAHASDRKRLRALTAERDEGAIHTITPGVISTIRSNIEEAFEVRFDDRPTS